MKNITSLALFALLSSCVWGGDGGGAPFGEACEVAEDCSAELSCITSLDKGIGQEEFEVPGGMCSNNCEFVDVPTGTPREQYQGTCDADAACLGFTYGDNMACFPFCDSYLDCRQGYSCDCFGVACEVSVCVP